MSHEVNGFARKWIRMFGMGLSGALLAIVVASSVLSPGKVSLASYAVIALGAILGAAFGRWIAPK
jgi:ABC-type xylose transport system permease subunit